MEEGRQGLPQFTDTRQVECQVHFTGSLGLHMVSSWSLGHPSQHLQLHRKCGGWREYVERLILLLQRVMGNAGPQLLASPPAAPIPPPAARPPSAQGRGVPECSAQEAGFKLATCSCLERGMGAGAQLYQGQLCSGRESSLLLSGEGGQTLGTRLALSLRPRELVVEVGSSASRG